MLNTILGYMVIFLLHTYDDAEMRSTDGTTYVKFEVLMLGYSLGTLDGIEVGCF